MKISDCYIKTKGWGMVIHIMNKKAEKKINEKIKIIKKKKKFVELKKFFWKKKKKKKKKISGLSGAITFLLFGGERSLKF